MALRWLLHLACHVLGHPMDNTEEQCKQNIASYSNGKHGEVKSLKGLSQQQHTSTNFKEVDYPSSSSGFQMPLHYPRYTKADYKRMEEWKVDLLLKQYGLSFKGTLDEKRGFAMGAFLWPDQH